MTLFKAVVLPVLCAASLGSTLVLAQSAPPNQRGRPSPETIQRMQDGKFAMAMTALKLNEAQMKLWAPVEAHIRATQTERLAAMQKRTADRQTTAPRAALPDLLDQASDRMTKRADRAKSFAVAFKPFYASLTEEQKGVIGPVLAEFRGKHMRGHRWANHRERGTTQQ